MDEEVKKMVVEAVGMLPTIIDAVSDSGALAKLAEINSEYREQLMAQGFTRDEAVQIIIHSKLLPENK